MITDGRLRAPAAVPPAALSFVRISKAVQSRVEYAMTRALEAGVTVLPAGAAQRVGEAIGALIRSPLRIRRSTVEDNLRRAFPDASEQWMDQIVAETYRHLGREAVAMVRLSSLTREQVIEQTTVANWGEIAATLDEGRGALLVTGHYGNWEVAAAAVAARGYPIEAVVKRQRNLRVDARVQEARRRLGVGTIDMSEAPRRIPRALASGHAIGMVADQDARASGVWVPFFDVPTSTFRGPALFALRFGAPVFAAVARRLEDGRYRVESERIQVPRTGDQDRDVLLLTAALAAHLEGAIREDPGQYFWFHKRWKTRPPTEHPNELFGTKASPGE
ncbi:lipid A biosynthesis lauroyl acyltransferase [soil metagenome]